MCVVVTFVEFGEARTHCTMLHIYIKKVMVDSKNEEKEEEEEVNGKNSTKYIYFICWRLC